MSDTPRLTRRQAAIIGAFTGILSGPFSDLHEYVDSLPGFEGIGTLGLAMQADAIRDAALADFTALCATDGGDR